MHTEKFKDPYKTAKGEERASVGLRELKTLWVNTGTQCNLSCENCYIESSPKNDRLIFFTLKDLKSYLDEIEHHQWPTDEIGFTGGEPLLNKEIIPLLEESLKRGYKTILLTNAFRINRYKEDFVRLKNKYGQNFLVRVSLDHFSQEIHEQERGKGTFRPTLDNMAWLSQNGISLAVAGRFLSDEKEEYVRKKYNQLFKENNIIIDVWDKELLVIFAEMDLKKDVPEITTSCWDILDKKPAQMMCSNSRMVVHRKGEENPKVLACTLLAYDKQFELGQTLKESHTSVMLNHPFCAQFCVLGGSSCS